MESLVRILEREVLLAQLDELLASAASGEGCGALVFGEAGIGKTALIERFTASTQGVRVLWGGCEALFTARPLGPLHDIAREAGGRLQALFAEGAEREALFGACLRELQRPDAPAILVLEDVHWADEATLDLIKYLGRRISSTSALLLVSYRDDAADAEHPLRSVLGDLHSDVFTRLRVPPLSKEAVLRLAADAGRQTDGLYEVTGGNPFFVTEVLSVDDPGVPDTVRDAVLARLVRLSHAARRAADLTSVSPTPVELWLLRGVVGSTEGAEECLAHGVLVVRGDTVLFRHELARRAAEDALSDLRRRDLHAAVLERLREREDEIETSRLVYHAELAGDEETVLRVAPRAAERAATLRAHREAAAYYRDALRCAGRLPAEEQARLRERCSYECYLTDQIPEAIEHRECALDVWEKLGDRESQGRNLRWLSRLSWYFGDNQRSREYAARCLEMLEPLPKGHQIAMAYSNQSQLHMLQSEHQQAVEWGVKAIRLARELDDPDTLAHALNNVGSAEVCAGDPAGWSKLEESLATSLEHRFQEHAARAYTNLSTCAVVQRDYERAFNYLDAGITYCIERDLDSWWLYMTAWRARAWFERGEWRRAEADAEAVIGGRQVSAISLIPALATLGHARVRRGVGDHASPLDRARELAEKTDELQRIAPVAAALAEVAWLEGDTEGARAIVEPAYRKALEMTGIEALGKLAYWLWKLGALDELPEGVLGVYAQQIRGEWRAAAEAWHALSCPYEEALALSESGEEEPLQRALEIVNELGAEPLVRRIRGELRELGVQGVARGPRASTRSNPAGLTDRQLEVLELLGEGLRNTQIAERLCIAPKTVGHHVSDILAKLDAENRGEAVARARGQGILGPR